MISKNKLNLVSLVSIQASNAVLPILIFPYLLNIAGDKIYAKIAVSEILSIVVLAIVVYGFDISGVKRVVPSLAVHDELSRVFNEVFFSRLLLLFISLFVLPMVYVVYDYETFVLTIFWYLIPLSYIFQNSYLFLAAQKNFSLALLNISSRFIAVAFVFMFIKSPKESFFAPALIGSCYLAGSIATFLYLKSVFRINIKFVGLNTCVSGLIDGFHIFLSNVSVLLYKDLNVVLLSLVTHDPSVVSSYSLAEKFVKSFQAVFRPISQHFFPKLVKSLQPLDKPDPVAFRIILKSTYLQLIIYGFIFIFLILAYYSFDDLFASYDSYKFSIFLFFVMSFSICFGISNFMFGSVGLNVLNSKRYFASAVLGTALVNVFFCLILARNFGAYGASICFVISEAFLFSLISSKYLTTTRMLCLGPFSRSIKLFVKK